MTETLRVVKKSTLELLEDRGQGLKNFRGEVVRAIPVGYVELVTLGYDIDYHARTETEQDVGKQLAHRIADYSQTYNVLGFTISMGRTINPRDLKAGIVYGVQLYARKKRANK